VAWERGKKDLAQDNFWFKYVYLYFSARNKLEHANPQVVLQKRAPSTSKSIPGAIPYRNKHAPKNKLDTLPSATSTHHQVPVRSPVP